jgi:hypothetical protein
MASLSAFKQNSRAREEGEWISPGPEFGDLQVKVRGLTFGYTDARAALDRMASMRHRCEVSALPAKVAHSNMVEALCSEVVLDVRNLEDDSATPPRAITADEFRALLRSPDYADLVGAVLRATAFVGHEREATAKAAEGNSPAASGGS